MMTSSVKDAIINLLNNSLFKFLINYPLVLAFEIRGAEELNPLTINQIPRVNSNTATGTANKKVEGSRCPKIPNRTKILPATSVGTPINPMIERVRGTSFDL